ncbi:hypothetical protein F383_34053 [Gossypium arboreum]|uniref:Uncharacterized protein n=1 Tax=Gossypium arboreum TaxID=29729 RepID=A0A0B0PLJ8_GOSAR|nr:hypothetical protein F383_34053 [Gossypium arboreum]
MSLMHEILIYIYDLIRYAHNMYDFHTMYSFMHGLGLYG